MAEPSPQGPTATVVRTTKESARFAIRDLSPGGARLVGELRLFEGEQIWLRIDLAEVVEVMCEVVHVDRQRKVAEVAFLSPSRFRHLFVEQTGMAFRPYVLWRRFLKVWELMTQGASLSSAAHGAGFADAAHLSRTSKQMFGFPPSRMDVTRPLGEETRVS